MNKSIDDTFATPHKLMNSDAAPEFYKESR